MKKIPSLLIFGNRPATDDLKEALEGAIKNLKIEISDYEEKTADALAGKTFDIIISLPVADGMKRTGLFNRVRKSKVNTPFIIVFDSGEEKQILQALSDGADFYVQENKKPGILAKELEGKIKEIIPEPGEVQRCEPDLYTKAYFMESPDGILVFDNEGRFKIVNPATCRMTGYSEEELLKLSIPEMHALAPDSEKEEISKFAGLLATGHLEAEMLFKRKDGSNIFMEINAVKISPSEYISFIKDITEKKEFTDALKESEDRYRSLFNGVPDYILVHRNGKILYANPVVADILGKREKELIGEDIMQFVAPESRKTVVSMMERRAGGEEIPPYEIGILTKSGQKITEVRGSVIRYKGEAASLNVLTDLTERRHAEEYTRLLARMSDDAPASIIVHDFDGNIIYANEETQRLHGFSRDEFMKRKLHDINVPESRKILNKKMQEIRDERELDYDVDHFRKDGSIFPMHVNFKIVEWEGREVLLNIATDITERKEAERLLKQNSFFLQQLIDAIPNPVFYKDTNGIYLGCNTAFEKYMGTRKDQVVGKSVYDLSPKELADMYKERDEALFKNPGIQKYESQVKYADDLLHDVIFYKATYTDINGETAGLVGIILDISDRKKMEEALKENEEKFRSYVNYAQESIFVSDPSGNFIDVNPAGCTMLGYTREEILNCKIPDFIFPADLEAIEEDVREINKTGHIVREIAIRRKDGTPVPVIINAVLMPDGNVLSIQTNVSELKNAEDGLREANRKLNLLSSITRHDILNQLTAIIAFLEMIEMDAEYPAGSKTAEYLEKISGAAQTIKRQLLFTKDYKDLGEQAPKWQKVSDMVEETAQNTSFAELKVENSLGDLEIYADPLFGKVIYNLFDNSIKHGEKTTKIWFSFEKTDSGGILVCEDDGMGVPEEFKEKILNRQHYSNTGLGLFLSGEILSTTGIKLRENGVYGEGARFEMRIPEGMFRFGE